MSTPDDPTPSTPREPSRPEPGTEPRADAPRTTEPGTAPRRPAAPSTNPPKGTDRTSRGKVEDVPTSGGRTAGVWVALVLGVIVLILLLVFILQNNTSATFHYFTGQFSLPLGVAMLLAAIAGALVMALVGSMRIFQQARTIRKLRKQQGKAQHMLGD